MSTMMETDNQSVLDVDGVHVLHTSVNERFRRLRTLLVMQGAAIALLGLCVAILAASL